MKKYIFLCCISLFFVSCGIKSDDTQYTFRTVIMNNETDCPIYFKITHAYASEEVYFDEIIPARTIKTIAKEKNAGLCRFRRPIDINKDYFWRLKTESNDTVVYFTAKQIQDIEKKAVPVFNNMLSDVKLEAKTKDNYFSVPPKEIKSKDLNYVYLYETNYDNVYSFRLSDEKMYYKKNSDGTFDISRKYPALQRNSADNPPEWAANPNNPADKDKVPLFFTINYNKDKKMIVIDGVK